MLELSFKFGAFRAPYPRLRSRRPQRWVLDVSMGSMAQMYRERVNSRFRPKVTRG